MGKMGKMGKMPLPANTAIRRTDVYNDASVPLNLQRTLPSTRTAPPPPTVFPRSPTQQVASLRGEEAQPGHQDIRPPVGLPGLGGRPGADREPLLPPQLDQHLHLEVARGRARRVQRGRGLHRYLEREGE